MNAVVYDDDNRIYSIEACKIYGPVDDIGISSAQSASHEVCRSCHTAR